jgi:hypothetical protein
MKRRATRWEEYVARVIEIRNTNNIFYEDFVGKDLLRDIVVDRMIILKLILKE